MTTRHEFLEQLHELLKPTTYLETGVQYGWSLQLSKAPVSIGIDPAPQAEAFINVDASIYTSTSDDWFASENVFTTDPEFKIDFAFIDGMHLAEYALRDFNNIERYSHPGTVVVLDDVLPTTSEMAAREMCPGDWTGDVWRVYSILRSSRPDLVLQLADTTPTGTLVVTGLDPERAYFYNWELTDDVPVPDWVIDRRHAWRSTAVLENLTDRGFAK